MLLSKYSFGIGDRFAQQGKSLLQGLVDAKEQGVDITAVWNKSHREHKIVGSEPADVRKEADNAVAELKWDGPYHVDADHIGLENVDLFIDASDFFTIDVANFIGEPADPQDVDDFVQKHKSLCGTLQIDGLDEPVEVTEDQIINTGRNFLSAIKQAEKIYHHIENKKGRDNFITEISMDETAEAQSPVKLLLILTAIADCKISAQTIAPKFTGSFYKGIDYVGDVGKFGKEFEEMLAVISYAVEKFSLSKNLKLSVHSGSDKFSIYPVINKALKKFDAGLHIKTAGTTWLEELIGLALAGSDGLKMAKQIYSRGLERFDELAAPYASVINIQADKLPAPETVKAWSSEQFAAALKHDLSCPDYNSDLRQLLHIAYKIAAEIKTDYLNALQKYEKIVARCVTENIYRRHIKPVFI
ncbi:MAG: tagaturonate epimerase family protein [Planctomycetota bacterium]